MYPAWFADLSFGLLCSMVGLAGGVLLRGRRSSEDRKRATQTKKLVTEEAVHGLQVAVKNVQSCVSQHSECLSAISESLTGGDANEAAASIIEANQLAEHQFKALRGDLDAKAELVREEGGSRSALMLTTLALDRQKHTYQRVLSSLESLAAEMAGDLDGCGRKMRNVSEGLEATEDKSATEVQLAVGALLDVVDDLGRSASDVELRLEESAERVQMQAIMSHADLLTSLPNRRALEEQLAREAASNGQKPRPCSLLILDLDDFGVVNNRYGYAGGDEVLRQAAMLMKRATRGQDTAARLGGDSFALTLSGTTLAQAMPIAERLRNEVRKSRFSEGRHQLSLTASIGIAQLQPGERPSQAIVRTTMAVKDAIAEGGDSSYYNDGQQCFPVSEAHRPREEEEPRNNTPEYPSIATLPGEHQAAVAARQAEPEPTLCGRSIFVANLRRRLAEWRRGGSTVSVVLIRIDQTPDLLRRHDSQAVDFMRRVLGRLLEAATRDMDQRCDYDEGIFAVLLPSADEQGATVIAQRLRSQVNNCKLRLKNELWDLSASIGVADAASGENTVDVLMAAAAGMERAMHDGGDAVHAFSELRKAEDLP